MIFSDIGIVGFSVIAGCWFKKLFESHFDPSFPLSRFFSYYFTTIITTGPIIYKHRNTKLTNIYHGNQPDNELTIPLIMTLLFFPSMFVWCFRKGDKSDYVLNFFHSQSLFLFTVAMIESHRIQPSQHHHQSSINFQTNFHQFAAGR